MRSTWRALVLAAVALAGQVASKQMENAHSKAWIPQTRAAPETLVTFRIALALAKSNEELEALLHARSDVKSPLYGQYFSHNDLMEHWQPHPDAIIAMQQVFSPQESHLNASVNAMGDYWHVRMPVLHAENLFETALFEYQHHRHHHLRLIRPYGEYTIPQSIASHVEYIDGLETFPTDKQAQLMQSKMRFEVNHDDKGTESDPFQAHTHQEEEKLDRVIHDAVVAQANDELYPSVVTPTMIRAQYGIPSDLNGTHPRNGFVISAFLDEYYKERDLQTFLEDYDDTIDLQSFEFPSKRGPCLAKGRSATGEASLDVQVGVSLTKSETIHMFCYDQRRIPNRPFADDNQEPFLTFLQDVNAMEPPPSVVSISYTDDECAVPRAYALAVDRELMKAAMKGITIVVSSGDQGAFGGHMAEGFCHVARCSKVLPMFPSSSPWITSVGATTFKKSRQGYEEVVTSAGEGDALITSGGGFSELFRQPLYQKTAVERYLNQAKQAQPHMFSKFNRYGRAYPDLAAIGHAFPVITQGVMNPTDGTSVSAPVVASMFNLINKLRLEQNKPMLGFVNPLLYQLHEVCPHVFQDIVDGDIGCGGAGTFGASPHCCDDPFRATRGWDAASGVGSLQFQAFVQNLDQCILHIQARHPTNRILMEQEQEQEQEIMAPQLQMQLKVQQVLVGTSLLVAVVLVGVLVRLRAHLFPQKMVRRGSASEFLLSDEDEQDV